MPDINGREGSVKGSSPRRILVCFKKDPVFAHFNVVVYHGYHRYKHRVIRIPNTGPRVDVNTYMEQCTAPGMMMGKLYAAIVNENMTVTLKNGGRMCENHVGSILDGRSNYI